MSRFTLFLLIGFCLITVSTIAQESEVDAIEDINNYKKEKDDYFIDSETSPLSSKDLPEFKNLEYFPINLNFRVIAKFKKHPVVKLFYMKTTTDRLPKYGRFAELSFEIEGKPYKLQAYQSQSLIGTEGYENYLFIPFTDLTSGDTSYGGGRYMDIDIPEGDEVTLDFNKTYNPYCAYNSKYSCPVPPRENDLNLEVLVGVKVPVSKY
jgi:uncharacterized protein (DUF1684 family)